MVGERGLEPPHPKVPVSKTGVATITPPAHVPLVAEIGIEPTPPGYEPGGVPFPHPAI